MINPLERSFRGLSPAEARTAEQLCREHASRLDQISDRVISCQVAVERLNKNQKSGSPYRVRVRVGVPGHVFIGEKTPNDHDLHDDISVVVRHAFDAVVRQLREWTRQQRGEPHVADVPVAFVIRLFREQGYGFLKTLDGQELFFHQSAVPNDWDRLEIGTQVRYVRGDGENGPQASTVDIIDKPGHRADQDDEIGLPMDWRP